MKQTVIGIFDDASAAAAAVTKLQAAGFGMESIDQSNTKSTGAGDTSAQKSETADDDDSRYDTESDSGHGVGGFFRSLFGGSDNNEEAMRYTDVANRSESIITVHAETEAHADKAAAILDECGAVDVAERAEQYGTAAQAMSAGKTADMGSQKAAVTEDTSRINIIEETLQVGKKTVETGGARLRSRIVSRPVEEQVRLRKERVRVERTAVDRPATEADFQTFQEGEMELIEHAEVPVVAKEARVVGEVSLNKDISEREETIRDTVRNTEVDVEELRAGSMQNNASMANGKEGTL